MFYSKILLLLFLCSFAFGGIDANLVLHYKMNDNDSNTTVLDSKGLSNGTAQRNTNLISVPGKAGDGFNFNPVPNSITVAGNLNPDASGTYYLTAAYNLRPFYQKDDFSIFYENDYWFVRHNELKWKNNGPDINGNYPAYNSLTVSGDTSPQWEFNGIYAYAGIRLGNPYYNKPYDVWIEGVHYTGFYEIFYDGINWDIGEIYYDISYLRLADSQLPVGVYIPIPGSGISGTVSAAEITDEGMASVSDVNLIVDTDYINTNLSLAQMKAIFQRDFTLSCWIKTSNFAGSCLAGTFSGSTLDFSSLFMAMGYYWNEQPYSFCLNPGSSSTPGQNEIADSYKNQWTMFTCTVEQSSPQQITVKQYLNGSLILTDTVNFVLAYWGEQNPGGSAITSSNPLYVGAYDGYNYDGEATEFMGYGLGCAFDDFMIFNKALSPEDVDWLYNNGKENALSDCSDIQAAGLALKSDLNGDCHVDFRDFSIFIEQWMFCNDPNNSDCISD